MHLLAPKGWRRIGILVALRTSVGLLDLMMAAAFYWLFLLLQGHPLPAAKFMPSWNFVTLAAVTTGLVCLRALTDVASARRVAQHTVRLQLDLMRRLLEGYRTLRWESFVAQNHSELASIAINTSREAAEYYHRLIELVAASLTTLLMIAALFYTSSGAACLLLLTTAGFYCFHRWWLRSRLRQAAESKEKALKAVHRSIYELFRCAREVRVYGRSGFFEDRVQDEAQRVANANLRVGMLPLIARTLADQGVVVLFLLVLIAAFLYHADTAPLVSTLVFFFIITRRMLPLLSQVSFIAGQMEGSYENVVIAAEELRKCENNKVKPVEPTLTDGEALIQCQKLSFAYSARTSLLRSLDLEVNKGEMVVLRGASGSGKSSLLNLLAGLIEARHGEVQLGTRAIAYVPQEIALLDASIHDNIIFGDSTIPLERVIQALGIVGLSDLVVTLPNGMDTCVGDNGTLLSGGQRQRLGLARAICRQPELLLLDEATSALDLVSERQVLQALRAQGCAIVLATHRTPDPSLITRTLTLVDGRLMEHVENEPLFIATVQSSFLN